MLLSAAIVSLFLLHLITPQNSAIRLLAGLDGMRELISSKIMLTHRGRSFFSCYTHKELFITIKEEDDETCFCNRFILICNYYKCSVFPTISRHGYRPGAATTTCGSNSYY